MATLANERTENIGARRLHTMIERLLDELSFEAPGLGGTEVPITAAVRARAPGQGRRGRGPLEVHPVALGYWSVTVASAMAAVDGRSTSSKRGARQALNGRQKPFGSLGPKAPTSSDAVVVLVLVGADRPAAGRDVEAQAQLGAGGRA